MGRETQKPVPWKTDASADKTRFAGKPRSLASSRRGSRAPSEAGDGANSEGDHTWKTTHDSAFGDSRPGSRLSHRSHATDEVVGFGDATSWRTTNREFQYDPNDFVPTPEKKHRDPNTADGRDPRGEIARRRSRIADPAGTGESGIGGWAGVPRMSIRKGAVDPLGGPDRGRSGVLMTHLEDGSAPRPEDDEPEAEKPFWTKRGVHPMRRKQPVGGSDVLTGLWMSSTTSYGMHAPDYQLTRREKTDKAAQRIKMQNEAPHRPDHVLSAVVHNAFLVDEGGAKVARRVVADEKEDSKRKAAAAMEAKLHRDLKKLDVLRSIGVDAKTDEEYSSLRAVRRELAMAKALYAKHPGWTTIDVTHRAIEEIAAGVVSAMKTAGVLPGAYDRDERGGLYVVV